MLQVLRDFRRVADALERLAASATHATQSVRENAPALDRLEALELGRAQFEADIEGILMKAEGKLKGALNSEARERHQRKKYEDRLDDFDPEGETLDAPVPGGNATGGQEEGVYPMRMGLALHDKTHAMRSKWGLA